MPVEFFDQRGGGFVRIRGAHGDVMLPDAPDATAGGGPTQPPSRGELHEVEDAFSLSSEQSFYYLIAENGNLQLGDETQPELRSLSFECHKREWHGSRT